MLTRRTFTTLLAAPLARGDVRITGYRVMLDRQKEGVPVTGVHGAPLGREFRLVFSAFLHDEEAGGSSLVTSTRDWGRTWTTPVQFGAELTGTLVKDRAKEFFAVSLCGPTRKGTLLATGFHMARGARTGDGKHYEEDMLWRPGTALVGLQPRARGPFHYQTYPTGTFLGEQFPAPGLILADGRVVLQIWGAKARGENWRCGVLLSDDDGVTWRYRDVGYEPDGAIRDKPRMAAGFNEQTLFDLGGGRLVSIIRGREKLGRVPGSPRDTFYFRSASNDGGESWSKPEATNMAGTGAPPAGVVLADSSLLTASRVCYSRDLYPLPDKQLFGIIFFRSRDEGRTWTPEQYVQHDPEGTVFDSHYSAMNGQFVQRGRNRWAYLFAQFDMKRKIHRLLNVELAVS